MNHALQIHESNVIDQAMAAFLRDAVQAKGKHKKKKPIWNVDENWKLNGRKNV